MTGLSGLIYVVLWKLRASGNGVSLVSWTVSLRLSSQSSSMEPRPESSPPPGASAKVTHYPLFYSFYADKGSRRSSTHRFIPGTYMGSKFQDGAPQSRTCSLRMTASCSLEPRPRKVGRSSIVLAPSPKLRGKPSISTNLQLLSPKIRGNRTSRRSWRLWGFSILRS